MVQCSMIDRARPGRPRFVAGLWALLALILLASIWFAVKMQQATRQRDAIGKLGGTVIYDYEGVDESGGTPRSRGNPPYYPWLRKVLGDDFLSDVVAAAAYRDADMVHLQGLPRVRFLSLYNQSVTDAGIEHLQPSKQFQTLVLVGTQVTGTGLKRLSELNQFQTLVIAHMPQITDVDVDQLKNLSQLQRLTLARISHQSVPLLGASQAVYGSSTEHCFCEAVAHCSPSIPPGEKCGLVESGVTDAGAAKLRKALPKCRIERL